MIPQDNRQIKRVSVPRIPAVEREYNQIVEDMIQNAGPLLPDPNWLIADGVSLGAGAYDREEALRICLSKEEFHKKYSDMSALMPAWIGAGQQASAESALEDYRDFLSDIDVLGLWQANLGEGAPKVPLLAADLGSIMDLNLLYAFGSSPDRKVTRLLEIGGGYGRLAEAAYNVFGTSISYVLIDAVPASLYYARRYLARACPGARIGSYYDVPMGGIEYASCDIAVVPAWHFEELDLGSFDVCINIESFQEMNQQHVDYYLSLFDAVSAPGTIIYLSNAHDYYFRGTWHYGAGWEQVFRASTPRSWTPDHPTEIFRKTCRNCSVQQGICDAVQIYEGRKVLDPQDMLRRVGLRKLTGCIMSEVRDRVLGRYGRGVRRGMSAGCCVRR